MPKGHFYLQKAVTPVQITEQNSLQRANFVWDLYVVMGNTKSSFGPAQFICKLGDFFKKARFFLQILTWAFFQDLQNGYLGDYIIFENSLKFDLYLLMESKWRTH